jgi:signal transduction histidine kinase
VNNRLIIGSLRTVAVAGVVIAIAGSAVLIAIGGAGFWWSGYGGFIALVSIFFSVFVWLVIRSQPRNAVLWSMAWSAISGGSYLSGWAAAVAIAGPGLIPEPTSVIPATLPPTAAWILVVTGPAFIGLLSPLLTFGLLLFPDGRFPSPRWHWVAMLAGIGIVATTLVSGWSYRPSSTAPFGADLAFNLGFGVVLLAAAASLVALLYRFRESRGETRDQFKWVVWGASIFLPAIIVGFALDTHRDVVMVIALLAAAVFLGSYGIAVGRYGLYNIDIVISRTVAYGVLAVFIAGVYVTAVTGIGQFIGSGPEPSPVLAIGAATVVAVAFQPLRRRLERFASRIVYGKKATPYEVLSEFSRRVAATNDSLLLDAARSLAEGTNAGAVAVWITADDRMAKMAEWPEGGARSGSEETSFPIEQAGAALGHLALSVPAGQRLSEEDRRLADTVASGMGLALRNRILTGVLQSRVEELGESRRRLAAVQNETRRKLERDLHDGAQQQLVALKVKLGLARAVAEKTGAVRTAAFLDGLAEEADGAVTALRDFARGVYPPLLEAEGLDAAVSAQVQRSPVPATVNAENVGRYDRQIEATVYFCIVQALQNVNTHANASQIRVSLAQVGDVLCFRIDDDGGGFDPHTARPGGGLSTIVDRVEAVNGNLTIDSAPGRGTVISGSIPVQATT